MIWTSSATTATGLRLGLCQTSLYSQKTRKNGLLSTLSSNARLAISTWTLSAINVRGLDLARTRSIPWPGLAPSIAKADACTACPLLENGLWTDVDRYESAVWFPRRRSCSSPCLLAALGTSDLDAVSHQDSKPRIETYRDYSVAWPGCKHSQSRCL